MSRVAAVGSEMPDCRAGSDWDKPWQRTGRFDLSSGAVGSPEARAEIIDALFAVFDRSRLPEAHSRPSPVLVDELDAEAAEKLHQLFSSRSCGDPVGLYEEICRDLPTGIDLLDHL